MIDSSRQDHRISRRTLLQGGIAGAGALLLSACGGNGTGGTASPTGQTGPPSTPSTKPDKLVVRTWGDPWESAYTKGPGNAFTQATGIPVEFDLTDYNEIQAKVREAVNAGKRPPVDVVLTTEDPAFAAGVQGISTPLNPAIVTTFDLLNDVGRPGDGSTNYVNPYSYTQPLVFAKDRVQLPADVSWEEIWDPKYRGRLFVTSTSPVSLLFPVAKLLGLDVATDDLTPAWDKIAQLQPNIAGAGDEEEFLSGVAREEFDIGITLVAVAIEDPTLDWVVPREGATMSFESLYVPNGLPQDTTYYAQVFIDEVLKADALTALAAALGEVPTNPDAKPASFMKGDPAFPFTQQDIDTYALLVSPEIVARNIDTWQAAYTAAIQG